MRRILPILLLFTLSAILCGCPYESSYNLDEEPQENIDQGLLGNWTATVSKPGFDEQTNDEEVTVVFEQRSEKEYDIAITGPMKELQPFHVITNDSIKGTANISTLSGKRFLNAFIHGRVYIAELVQEKSAVSIYPLAEYFTSKLIKNSRELRSAVEFHYRVRLKPGYDKSFALKNLRRMKK